MRIIINETIFVLVLLSKQILSLEDSSNMAIKEFKKCFDLYCLPLEYSNLYGPFEESGVTRVRMDFDISHISEIDDIRFSVTLVMHLGMTWDEPRLIGPGPLNSSSSSSPSVSLDNRFVDILWFPDLYIFFVKEIKVPKFTNDFSGLLFKNFNKCVSN